MEITNDSITYANRVYPVRNISSAAMVERTVERGIRDADYVARKKRLLKFAAWVGGFGVVYMIMPNLFAGLLYPLGILPPFVVWNGHVFLFIGAAAVVLNALRRPIIKVTEYGVELQTNAGSISLIWSPDRPFIERLKEIIFRAISSSGSQVQYTVNVDNREFRDLSQNTFNTTNNVTFDYSISFTEHKGISPEQLQFLSGAFNTAMKDLAASLAAGGGDATLAELRALREEMAKPAPDRTALQRAYDRLKATCEAHETATTTAGLLGTIWTGVSMFF